jgi:hypothetical protein
MRSCKPLAHVLLCFALASPLAMAQNAKAGRFYEDALKRYQAQDLDGATVQLKNALQEDRKFLPALMLLGRASLENSSPGAAEGAFLAALDLGVPLLVSVAVAAVGVWFVARSLRAAAIK